MPAMIGDAHRENLSWVGKLGEPEADAMVSLAAKMLHEGKSPSTVCSTSTLSCHSPHFPRALHLLVCMWCVYGWIGGRVGERVLRVWQGLSVHGCGFLCLCLYMSQFMRPGEKKKDRLMETERCVCVRGSSSRTRHDRFTIS